MTLLLTLLIMAVVGVVAAVAAGRIAGGLDAPASSLPGRGLPDGPVDPAAVDRVRFSPALRGYRMDEVDDALDRVTDELRRRDAEIARLREESARLRRQLLGGGLTEPVTPAEPVAPAEPAAPRASVPDDGGDT